MRTTGRADVRPTSEEDVARRMQSHGSSRGRTASCDFSACSLLVREPFCYCL